MKKFTKKQLPPQQAESLRREAEAFCEPRLEQAGQNPTSEAIAQEMESLLDRNDSPEMRARYLKRMLKRTRDTSKKAKEIRKVLAGEAPFRDFDAKGYRVYLSHIISPADQKLYRKLSSDLEKQKKAEEEYKKEISNGLISIFNQNVDISALIQEILPDLSADLKERFINRLKNDRLISSSYEENEILDGISLFVDRILSEKSRTERLKLTGYKNIRQPIREAVQAIFSDLFAGLPRIQYTMPKSYRKNSAYRKYEHRLLDELAGIPVDEIMAALSENPYYASYVRSLIYEREELQKLESEIPTFYPDFFPKARGMFRHFYIHVGPTNSGKTYQGIEALKRANSGTYLAPLRLLAFEVYEDFVEANIPVSMITGEEEIIDDDAKIVCSTCEMADLNKVYDVAVVDECQMISDPGRGGAWTNAILGLQAYEIHLCCAPQAVDLMKRLIEDCHDTYEVIEHERLTSLDIEDQPFNFPNDARKGDALIVFSKRKVHAVAAQLQKAKKKVSIIYGALPYTVRQNEARRFRSGESDILVSTDAIGMGLNLPIRRVVFLEDEKFDGYQVRPLNDEEILQIAGRAGRYGVYDQGLFTGTESYAQDHLRHALNGKIEPIEKAIISFPSAIVNADARISEILKYWNAIPASEGYQKQDILMKIELAQWLEKRTSDKNFILKMISMTLDEGNMKLLHLWQNMALCELQGTKMKLGAPLHSRKLDVLEEQFRKLDLFYQYFFRFGSDEDIREVMDQKQDVSYQIMKILKEQKLKGRTCRQCGRPLPWNYTYNICQVCFQRRHEDDWDDPF